MMSNPMISFRWVSKSFTTPEGELTILQNTSLDVHEGDFVALMWPSWSGKTTFLNLIAGLETQQAGEIMVHDTDLSMLSVDEKTLFRGQYISFVFQQFHLLPQLTVAENIDLVIELNKLDRRFATVEILEKVGLAGREKSYPSTLSGGEQQRVALARAFVGKTPLLLADEPTGNLDQHTAQTIMQLMTWLHKEVNNTIVMITHDAHVATYADITYIFDEYNLKKA